MRILDTISTANANLRRSKLRTGLTISAVFIGAFTLSLTNGLGAGANQFIDSQLKNVSAKDSLVVSKKSEGSGNPLSSDVQEYKPGRTQQFGQEFLSTDKAEEIKTIAGGIAVYPVYQVNPEYVTTGDKKYVGAIQSYTPGLKLDLAAGQLIPNNEKDSIIIPESYAKVLFGSTDKAIGNVMTINLKEPTGSSEDVKATVSGVTRTSIIANGALFVSQELTQQMDMFMNKNVPQLQNKVQAMIVTLPAGTSKIKTDDIKKKLDAKGYNAKTLEDQIGTIKGIIAGIQAALNAFGIIALLAASFGIINTLLMAVYERTREVGLLKSLGMGRRTIFAIFALEAVSIGFWGGALGVLASMLAGNLINKFATATFLKDFTGFHLLAFPIASALGVLGLIMVIAFLAGVLPSIKASRLNPIEALRYE